jgi:hypothetical protein
MSKLINTLGDLTHDDRNANKGTNRGKKMVAQSLKDYGAGRSVLADRDGRIIAGNKSAEAAEAAGIQEVIVVPTDGTKLVVVQRTDLSLDDPKARQLAIADNRSSEVGLDWDLPTLESFRSELPLEKFWSEKELGKMFGEPPTDSEPMPEAGYGVLIENLSEQQQLELLERFATEGLTAKAMIF